jgi:hypothetical protein
MIDKLGKPCVIVVSGLPRSGTSLMMQMLCAGGVPVLADDLRPADRDNPRGYFEYEPVKRTKESSQWVALAVGKAVKVVHLLLPELPSGFEYKIIFMQRDMDEVLRSQTEMLQRQQRQGADLPAGKLAEVFSRQVANARRWMAEQSNATTLDVKYEDVINDPASQARRVNEFLGGVLDETRMAAAVDPLLHRQRR